jgi:hypothetical protein
MSYLIDTYWPFLVLSLAIGVAVGWWNRDRGEIDDVAAWLEDGPGEQ